MPKTVRIAILIVLAISVLACSPVNNNQRSAPTPTKELQPGIAPIMPATLIALEPTTDWTLVSKITPMPTITPSPTPAPHPRTIDGLTAEKACGYSKDGPVYIVIRPWNGGLKRAFCVKFEENEGSIRLYYNIDENYPQRPFNWNEVDIFILFPYHLYQSAYMVTGHADDFCEISVEGSTPDQLYHTSQVYFENEPIRKIFQMPMEDPQGHIYMWCKDNGGAGWFDLLLGFYDEVVID